LSAGESASMTFTSLFSAANSFIQKLLALMRHRNLLVSLRSKTIRAHLTFCIGDDRGCGDM
jgi:hypothetical protein